MQFFDQNNVLSKRESEVAHLVTKGLSNREIGFELFITEKTVKYHLSNVYKKLGLKRRSQLFLVANTHASFEDKVVTNEKI